MEDQDRNPDELRRLLGELVERSGRPQSIAALFRSWGDFVELVERGYEDSIYEYTNDLSVRDLLQQLIDGAGAGLSAEIAGQLADPDRRFEAATEETDRPLGEFTETPPWWWRRVPLRLVGELAEDLASR